MIVKVVALNDDNHPKSYLTRWDLFSNAADFIKELLLTAHNNTYEVREVYICEPQGALAEMPEEEFCDMFDLLHMYSPDELAESNPEKFKKRQAAFELFWENGEEWKYA